MGGELTPAHLHNACPQTHCILFLEKRVFFFDFFLNTNISPQNIETP